MLEITWFSPKALSTNYRLKKSTISICPFTWGVFRTGLNIERELVTSSTDQKGGLTERVGF